MRIYRPTWAEISKGAFARNVRQIKKKIGSKVDLLAVLKADAYGHGANSLAAVALRNGASEIGVSSLEEGIALREQGITQPILILGGLYPFKNFDVALAYHLTPTIASLEAATFLWQLAKRRDKRIAFHLKVDTGMGRIGVSPRGAKTVLNWLLYRPELKLSGLYSHFSCADSNPAFTRAQLNLFEDVRRFGDKLGIKQVRYHMANSAATLRNRASHLDMVRPGITLYGGLAENNSFSPVLKWQTQVIFLKYVKKRNPH